MLIKPLHACFLSLFTAALLLPATAWSMRCGSALINKGDSQAKVLAKCGEPATRSSRYALRTGLYVKESGIEVNGDSAIDAGRYYPYARGEVLIENWVYNFGPNQLMRQVTFADGIVEDVKTLGYGYYEDD